MKRDEIDFDEVDDYLADRLPPAAEAAFELKLLTDAGLQEAVEIQSKLKQGIATHYQGPSATAAAMAGFMREVFVENFRGSASKLTLSVAQSVCLSVDVGPFHLEEVDVAISLEGHVIEHHTVLVDEEGLASLVWCPGTPGVHLVTLSNARLRRVVEVEVI